MVGATAPHPPPQPPLVARVRFAAAPPQEELKGKIRVYCRVRPQAAKESGDPAIEIEGTTACQIHSKGQ